MRQLGSQLESHLIPSLVGQVEAGFGDAVQGAQVFLDQPAAGRAADTDTCSNMLRTSFIEAWGVGGWVWSFGVLLGGDGVGL